MINNDIYKNNSGLCFYYNKLKKLYKADENGINIVLITDNKYFNTTMVCIASMIKSKRLENIYNINVICININIIQKANLFNFQDDKININVIDVKNTNYGLGKIRHISTTALYKFNLPFMLLKLEKVLYIDTDTIIVNDLKEIYDQNINEVYVGAVKDRWAYFWPTENFNDRLNINHSGYFNSGVMLLNLKLMRSENINYELWNYRVRNTTIFMDQDTFNVILGEKVKYFPFKYNMISTAIENLEFEELKSFYSDVIDDNWLQNGIIYHYASGNKPWNSSCLYYEKWQAYYKYLKSHGYL